MDSNAYVIVTQGLGRRFGATVAVAGIDLQVAKGEVFGLLGHNGAGKTTTVRLLNGVLTPSMGSARVLGMDPSTEGPRLRRRTGVLTETPGLTDKLTARENLTLFAEMYEVPRDRLTRRVGDLLALFGLEERADEPVGGYSRGMRQRLAIARALLHDPEIVFLDEPTAGLDPVASRQVHELIARLTQEERRTIVLCTHNLLEAQRLCSRVAVLARGAIVAMGTPRELARRLAQSSRLTLEVAPEDEAIARAAIEDLGGAQMEATTPGAMVVTGIDRERVPKLVAVLAQAGVRVYRVSPHEPTLEDAYFDLQPESEVTV
ncbi:MAG TPA: ABC transporter ATP-binding protein [Chloroflexi bacterium]|jgi:ABC-2 type transport system ATP-binding protein|nr:ABC transporter ATP-binding protein [Chloroflexota bacterium]